jgi:hypothetical protein
MQWLALPDEAQKKLLKLCVLGRSNTSIVAAMEAAGVDGIKTSDVAAFKRANEEEISQALERCSNDLLLGCHQVKPEFRISQLGEIAEVLHENGMAMIAEEDVGSATKILGLYLKMMQELSSNVGELKAATKENKFIAKMANATPDQRIEIQRMMIELQAKLDACDNQTPSVSVYEETEADDIIDAEFEIEE